MSPRFRDTAKMSCDLWTNNWGFKISLALEKLTFKGGLAGNWESKTDFSAKTPRAWEVENRSKMTLSVRFNRTQLLSPVKSDKCFVTALFLWDHYHHPAFMIQVLAVWIQIWFPVCGDVILSLQIQSITPVLKPPSWKFGPFWLGSTIYLVLYANKKIMTCVRSRSDQFTSHSCEGFCTFW